MVVGRRDGGVRWLILGRLLLERLVWDGEVRCGGVRWSGVKCVFGLSVCTDTVWR